MAKISKIKKTIDMEAFIRWLLRKWKSGLLVIIIATVIGGGTGVIEQRKIEQRKIEQTNKLEDIEYSELTKEEQETVGEYLKYDIYVENTLDIINMLEENIQESLETADVEKMTEESLTELSDKIKLLETYQSYYSTLANTQNGLKISFNVAQSAYINSLENKEDENLNEESDVAALVKNGIKMGIRIGIIVGAVWLFVAGVYFGLNKRIKSKEDVLAINGEIPIIESSRGIVRNKRVKIEDNPGMASLMSADVQRIINLAGKLEFEKDEWNNKLKKDFDTQKDIDVILVVEIGVSLYEDIFRVGKEHEGRIKGCVCVR